MGEGSGKSTSLIEKLENLDNRILYWILIVVIVIPYLNPLGIPVPITQTVRKFYDTFDGLPPGSTVLLDITSGPAAYGEIGAGTSAFMEFLTKIYPSHHNGDRLKVVIISSTEQGPIMYDAYAKPIFDKNGWEYGEDYAYFGYIAGLETFVARLAEDIPSLLQSDYLGNSVANLPVMEGIQDYTDINLVVLWDSGSAVEWFVKQWSPKGVPVGGIFVAVSIPKLETYIKSGDLFGFIGSSRGSAELEILIGKPGEAVATTDTLSLSHLWVIFLIILGNVGFYARKISRGGER